MHQSSFPTEEFISFKELTAVNKLWSLQSHFICNSIHFWVKAFLMRVSWEINTAHNDIEYPGQLSNSTKCVPLKCVFEQIQRNDFAIIRILWLIFNQKFTKWMAKKMALGSVLIAWWVMRNYICVFCSLVHSFEMCKQLNAIDSKFNLEYLNCDDSDWIYRVLFDENSMKFLLGEKM